MAADSQADIPQSSAGQNYSICPCFSKPVEPTPAWPEPDQVGATSGEVTQASSSTSGIEQVNSWRSYLKEHATRLFSTEIYKIGLLPHERRLLLDKQKLGDRASSYLAWRCSVLANGAFFFLVTVSLQAVFLIDPWNTGTEGDQNFILKHVAVRYRGFFDDLVLLSLLHQYILFATSCFSVVLACIAAWNWCSAVRSARLVQGSFALSFLPPFVLLLILPFRHAVDFEGVQHQMCLDILNGTRNAVLWADNVSSSYMWPGKMGGLANELVASYGVEVPRDFCDKDPSAWGAHLSSILESAGFLLDPATDTCRRAEEQIQDLLLTSVKMAASRAVANLTVINASSPAKSTATSASNAVVALGAVAAELVASSPVASSTGAKVSAVSTAGAAATNVTQSGATALVSSKTICGTVCSNCTTSCQPHLTKLAALSSIYSIEALKGLELGGASRCTHCFTMKAGTSCASNCSDVVMALSRQAVSGKTPDRSRVCIKPADLKSFSLMVELGTQTSYWKMLLGSLYALKAFGALLPLTFSLLLGAAKGSSICKSVVPYSRTPDVISTSAAVFTFPFIFVVAVLIQSTFGTIWTLLGLCLLLVGVFTKMNPGLMTAQTEEDFGKSKNNLGMASKITLSLALVAFVVALVTNGTVQSVYALLKDQGIELTDAERQALGQQFVWTCIQMACTFLGKSLVSTIFFADGIIGIMHRFHYGEDNDPLDIRIIRNTLVYDIHTMLRDVEEAEVPHVVHPESPPDDTDEAGLLKAQAFIANLLEKKRAATESGEAMSSADTAFENAKIQWISNGFRDQSDFGQSLTKVFQWISRRKE